MQAPDPSPPSQEATVSAFGVDRRRGSTGTTPTALGGGVGIVGLATSARKPLETATTGHCSAGGAGGGGGAAAGVAVLGGGVGIVGLKGRAAPSAGLSRRKGLQLKPLLPARSNQ